MFFDRYPNIRTDLHRHAFGVIWWGPGKVRRTFVSKTSGGCLTIEIGRLALYIGKPRAIHPPR